MWTLGLWLLLASNLQVHLSLAEHPGSPFGAPISDWYFVIRSTPSWIPLTKAPYCGFSTTPGQATDVIVCDRAKPPYFNLFTLVNPTGQLPAHTGDDLLLVSHTGGLCSTQQPSSPAPVTHTASTTHAGSVTHTASSKPRKTDADSRTRFNLADSQDADSAASVIGPKAVTWPDFAPVVDRAGVACRASFEQAPSKFKLLGSDGSAGAEIDIFKGGSYYLLEGDKYCTIVDSIDAKASLVCDLNTTAGAVKFQLLPAALPSVSLASFASSAPCGIKSLLLPPPHDLICAAASGGGGGRWLPHAQDAATHITTAWSRWWAWVVGLVQGRTVQYGLPRKYGHIADMTIAAGPTISSGYGSESAASSSSRSTAKYATDSSSGVEGGGQVHSTAQLQRASIGSGHSGRQAVGVSDHSAAARLSGAQDDRAYSFTLLVEKPGTKLTSGSTIAIVTYSPGLVGFPLQQCCPQLDSPHVVDCGVAGGDPLPNECWFNLYKVGAKSGEPLNDGDLIMLQSKAFSRYCSITLDGTMLCVSASPSNATRNLFLYQQLSSGSGHLVAPN